MAENHAAPLRMLVSNAVKAASSHNTQPWRFRLEERRITIVADLARRCPIVDPDDHHLYASLGCALENLVVTAPSLGLRAHVDIGDSGSITVELENASPATSPLQHAIEVRQCTRCEYDGSALTPAEARALEEAGASEGVSLRLLTEKRALEQIADYVAAGNSAQFADPAWRQELRNWVRFNTRRANESGDGLFGPSMGNPAVPDWLGRLFMQVAFSVKRQNQKDIGHIRSSSAVAVFISERNDIRHWVKAGRCYERFALQAAALGLRTAFINQPVEVASLRQQFSTHLGVAASHRPDLIVRVGRGPLMPRSFRRPVDAVIV